jgi:hypothetical protein
MAKPVLIRCTPIRMQKRVWPMITDMARKRIRTRCFTMVFAGQKQSLARWLIPRRLHRSSRAMPYLTTCESRRSLPILSLRFLRRQIVRRWPTTPSPGLANQASRS